MEYQPRQIRRGTNTQRVALLGLAAGELGFETDTQDIYIGSASGDKLIADRSALDFINGQDQAVKTTSSPTFAKTRFNPKKQQALVTFCFDDGAANDYTEILPIFAAQGEVACSAIVTNDVEAAGTMTWVQIQALSAAGWEVLSHSVSHANLTGLTEAEVIAELENSKTILEGHSLVVNNLAYPYNASNKLVRQIARKYYRSARAAGGLNPQILETFKLRSYECVNINANLAVFQGNVDSAAAGNKWLIFYIHSVSLTAPDRAALNTLIDYIQAKPVDIVTFDQALDLVENMIDIGDVFAVGEEGVRIERVESSLSVEGNMNIDGTTVMDGNVTIGRASTNYKFDVLGAVKMAGANVGIVIQQGTSARTDISADANLLIKAGSGGALLLYANSLEKMRITDTGFVGIGKTEPLSKLAVVGLPSYANNAAAISGGQTAGDFYCETGTNPLRIAVVS